MEGFQEMLIWSSMRYFMGSQTIAASTWPAEFIKKYGKKITTRMSKSLYTDLKYHFDDFGKFGHESIDSPTWEKFMNFLSGERYEVTAEGNGVPETKLVCFKSRDTYYSVEKYLDEPYKEIYVAPEFIKSIIKI